MLKLKTEKEKKYIINNVTRACRDISKLTKAGYSFLYLASGFIAHYDRYGFMYEYSAPGSLREDILRHAGMNTYSNFRPGERDYEYYHQKAEIYAAIVKAIQ